MRNRYLAALCESSNVVLLSGTTVVSLACAHPLPLLGVLGFEAVYLALAPRTKWYEVRLQRQVEVRRFRQRQLMRLQTLPRVRPALRTRYDRLEMLRSGLDAQITRSYPHWVGELPWLRDVRDKLDSLLEKFLHFAAREAQFRANLETALRQIQEAGYGRDEARAILPVPLPGLSQLDARGRGLAGVLPPVPPCSDSLSDATPTYLSSLATTLAQRTPPEVPLAQQRHHDDRWTQQITREIQSGYEREMADLARLREADADEDTCAVLDSRLDVLQRRRSQIAEIGRILTNLNHQMRLVEDAFGLISNELSTRPPEQILSSIEDVVGQTETMMSTLKEILPYEPLP